MSEVRSSADDYVTNTRAPVNLRALRASAEAILKRFPFNEKRQVCLTHRAEIVDSSQKVYGGTGPLNHGSEFDFGVLNEDFHGTYLYDFFKGAQRRWKLGRTRLMLLPPRVCYPMHQDVSPYRYHIALQTNEYCFFTFADGKMFHVPADGHIYRLNGTRIHSAFNGGKTERIHIVFEITDLAQSWTVTQPNLEEP
jgi:hypothetical protein